MNVPVWVKPAIWGMVGGGIVAIVIGFAWGGWVTGGAAIQMETASAKAAVILAFTPLCVAKAEQQSEKFVALKEESTYKQGDFVVEAGWVDNVSEKYRAEVAKVCAISLIEGIKAD